MTDEKIAHVFTQVFSSPAGQQVLKHLEKVFPEKAINATDGDLRFFAGNRAVICLINRLIEKGMELPE